MRRIKISINYQSHRGPVIKCCDSISFLPYSNYIKDIETSIAHQIKIEMTRMEQEEMRMITFLHSTE